MSSKDSVTQWVAALKNGDQDAARRLWERYFEELVRLARQKLALEKRQVADEEDVALSVFDSLCKGAAAGRFTELAGREDLWYLLLSITKQKSIDHIRFYDRQKRGGSHHAADADGEKPIGRNIKRIDIEDIVSKVPTPDDLAAIDEDYQRLLGLLRDDTLRRIAVWKMEGSTNQEIAHKLGISIRSIERKLKLIREKWAKVLGQ